MCNRRINDKRDVKQDNALENRGGYYKIKKRIGVCKMKKRSAIIVAIILMSIGFAAVSTTLVINGNAKVSENEEDFSVIFTAASIDGKDVYSTVVDDTKKVITFETSELKTLNQTSVLSYEVTNNSSNYDAEVSVTCVPKDGTTAKYTSIKNKLDNDTTKVLAKETLNGTLTITLDRIVTDSITEEYRCKLEFNAAERNTLKDNIPEPVSFTSDSWEAIQKAIKLGNTSKYKVGDTKIVDMGSFGTQTVRISNMSLCTNGEISETACGFVVEFVDVITDHDFKTTETNIGGWKDSDIRAYINNSLFNSLPSDLQKVISSTKVISSHGNSEEENFESKDKLYLLSCEEIYGDFASSTSYNDDTSVGISKQLDYYKNKGVTTKNYSGAKKQKNKVDSSFWLRSAKYSNTTNFLRIRYYGGLSDSSASNSDGISPAFRIA